MKRYIFIAAAFAIALVSCSKIYDATPVSTDREIGFGTWAETLTKTVADPTNPRVQGTNYFRSGDGIVVYGSKVISSTPSVVFNGVDVVATAEGGTPTAATTWDYNNHRFWDTNASEYRFFAVSPKGKLGTTTTTAEDGAFVTSSLSFNGHENDFLVADKTVVEKGTGDAASYFNNYGTVNLVFNHAAALVDVHVKKSPALADAAVKISAITIENVYKTGALTLTSSDYNKTISARTTVPNITVAKWAPSAPGTYLPAEGVTPVYGDVSTLAAIAVGNEKAIATDTGFTTGNTTTNTTPSDGESTILFNNLVVVPQTFTEPTSGERADPNAATTAQKIKITYTITPSGGDTNTYTSSLFLYDFDSIDNGAQAATYVGSWEPGKHYIFYITIDSHAITFSAEINPWEATVYGYHYLTN